MDGDMSRMGAVMDRMLFQNGRAADQVLVPFCPFCAPGEIKNEKMQK
jgi:hypothetical protein